jgi:manganese-dependent inorganic pyrophosphatase
MDARPFTLRKASDMRPILVFGHRNPDSDSICAAIAYAHLRNRVDDGRIHVPVRLGDIPAETVWMLRRWGVAEPELITHVRLRVRDAMTEEPLAVHAADPLLAAGRLMRDHDIRMLPVVDEGAVLGIVSTETLAGRYLDVLEEKAAGTYGDEPIPLVRDVMDTDHTVLDPDMLLKEAAEEIVGSPHRSAVVVDEGRLVGVLTRTSLARARRREVVLVDHNERSQSADGIEKASVVEVIDHHRIGDIESAAPIAFTAQPVGSTCTLVALRYAEERVPPPPAMAGLMLGALLSDTVLLKSPTTTELDREAASRLASHAEVDVIGYGTELYAARAAGEPFSAERAVAADLKEFRIGIGSVGIAQYETPDAPGLLAKHRDELLASMADMRERRGWPLMLLMVTDILREGTELLAVGDARPAERAFAVSLADGSAWLPGVLSRKKQVVAPLAG